MVAPQDYDVRQSGILLELQNSDLWLRPTDLSWHFPIFMTTREEPFKNDCSREAMMNGIMPTGKHHLVHGTNQ